MGKIAHSADKSKDVEDGTSKGQHNDDVQISAGGDSSRNQSGLRTRKSERLEKLTPTKPSQQLVMQTPRKPSDGKRRDLVQNGIQSPLRRSERGKTSQQSSSSSSKREEKSSSSEDLNIRNNKKEKRVEDPNTRKKGLERLGQNGSRTDRRSTKRIDARTYRSMLKTHRGEINASATKLRKRLEYSPVKSYTACHGIEKLQNGKKGQTTGIEEGSSHGSVGRLNDDDVKWSKSDSRNRLSERLRSEKCSDSSDCANIGSREKPSDLELKGSNFRSEHDGIASNRKRGYSGHDGSRDYSSTADIPPPPSLCRSGTGCSYQSCSTGSKRKRGDSEVCNSMLLTNRWDQKLQQEYSMSNNQICGNQNTCVICKLTGELFCCSGKGCGRSYHPLCLDSPLKDIYPGVWHCPMCLKKKNEFGVHAVSEGMEYICGDREADVLNSAGLQKQKQYFVKYKGLAFAHNLWIDELQLLHEAPQLLVEFNQKNEDTEWKPEWALPHRVLQKWLLRTIVNRNENASKDTNCDCNFLGAYLVKWCGLDYDNTTWELEGSSFFKTPEGLRAMEEYETRHYMIQEMNKNPSVDFPKVPASGLPVADSIHMTFVSKLREYWHSGRNCFIINDQGLFEAQVVSFILSLQQEISRPFFIITPYLLSSWEAEFLRLAPSINVVVYGGSTNTRKGIRKLEFQECERQMFQVLLSAPGAISEDLEALNFIEWEAIIVEECLHSEVDAHSANIKMLNSYWRFLHLSRNLEDAAPDYIKMLSLLKSGGNPGAVPDKKAGTNHNISMLKKSLSQYTFSGCKPQPSRFAEYWVPAHLSNLQLEQYSSILLSNSMSLRSVLKNDLVGALHEIIVSTLKCCNHPYVPDPSLQSSLAKVCTQGDLCDVGCKASGKLQLLDAILSESKSRGFRFLILYQPVGSYGKDNIGDILEDYLQYRFGTDSYERIDAFGYRHTVKQAACNNFNTVKSRFIFLLESRACFSSIKLSAVDAIIVFNSDRNPINDLRALQKITIDSKSEQINMFRLYSFCTIEENILALAKNGGNVPSISHTNHMLLMMGASYLFSKLDEFHHDSHHDVTASIVPKDSFIKDVLHEFLTLIENHGKEVPPKFMSKAVRDGDKYQKNTTLLGEAKYQPIIEESPLDFWLKLLDGRQPKWKYLSTSSQRNRKRPQYFESPSKNQESQNDGSPKKRKKVGANNVDSSLLKDGAGSGRRLFTRNGKGISEAITNELSESSHKPVDGNGSPEIPQAQVVESEGKRKLLDEQSCLLQLLRPQVLELCQVLQLQEDVSKCAERFLEYVIKNHRVSKEPESILQAFQISVCWTAASLMGQKIDHKESVVLARERLKLACKEDEAELVYSKMKSLKRAFLLQSEELKSAYSKDPSSVPSGLAEKTLKSNAKEAVVSYLQKLRSRAEEGSPSPRCSNKPPSLTVDGTQKDILKKVKKVEKKCRKRIERLKEKQIIELEELHRDWEAEKEILEKMERVESVLIHSIHTNIAMRADKLKQLANDYSKRRQELEHKMTTRLKDLQASQQMAKNEEQQKAASLVKKVKLWVQDQLLNKPPSLPSTEMGANLHATEQNSTPEGPKDADSVSGDPVELDTRDRHASCEPGNLAEPPDGDSEPAKLKVDFVASLAIVYAADKHARADEDVTEDNIGVAHSSDEVVPENPLEVEPFMSGSSDMATTEDIPAIPMDEGIPDVVLQDVPTQHHGAALERGTPLESLLISDLQTEQNAGRMDTGISMESISPATNHHVGDNNLACSELPNTQPPVVSSSITESQVCLAQLCEPLEAVRDQAEAISEASLAHYVNASGPESEGSSPIILADPTCIPPFPIDEEETTLSTDIHGNQPTVYDTSLQVIGPPVAVQYLADSVNSVLGSSGPLTVGVPVGSGISNPNARSTIPRFGGVPMQLSSPVTLEPLQVEYDRVSREKDLAVHDHEQKMSQLVKDCDKEIEEAVARIRQKYVRLRAEAEASFLVNKKELDMIQNKALMNKLLAEAFRAKLRDQTAILAARQAMHMNHAPQLLQQQRSATIPASGTFSAPSSGSAFSGASSVYRQNSAPTPAPAPALTPTPAPAARAPITPSPAAPRPAAPPTPAGRVAGRSPTPLPNNPVRPPQSRPPVISSISPNTSSYQQGMIERRAPPPHLQPFRPAMSMPPRSLSVQVPGITMPHQPIVSSPSAAAQLASRSIPPHLQTSLPLPRTPMQVAGSASHAPMQVPASDPLRTPHTPARPLQLPPQVVSVDESGTQIRANLTDTGRRLATIRLQEYNRSLGLNQPSIVTTLPEQPGQSDSGGLLRHNVQPSSPTLSGLGDLIFLSDDES